MIALQRRSIYYVPSLLRAYPDRLLESAPGLHTELQKL